MLYSISKYPMLSYENISTKISDYEIYSHYLGANYELGKAYTSPLRVDDSNPSFGLFESGDGKILFKDQGTALTGNAVQFVQHYYHLPSYDSAICRIYIDLIWNQQIDVSIDIKSNKIITRKKVDIGVKRQPISQIDINYWGSFNIDQKTLDLFEVSPIKYLFTNEIIRHYYTNDNPMYAFKVYNALKIYRPFADKSQKWYGSTNRTHIFGYKQLPKEGELLIITKSLKDVMCLYTLGYNAISPASEGTLIPNEVISDLKKRFKIIVLLYDNDEPGKKYTERMSKKYNLPFTYIPEDSEEKDISDYVKHYGSDKAKEMLIWQLQKYQMKPN